jgi:Na+/H+ antiporter NhaD/arsenite permease-like protein
MQIRFHLMTRVPLLVLVLSAGLTFAAYSAEQDSSSGNPGIIITGRILDLHKEPVREAEVRLWITPRGQESAPLGKPLEEVLSAPDGIFIIDCVIPETLGPSFAANLEVTKPNFKPIQIWIPDTDFARKGRSFFLERDFLFSRKLAASFWIAAATLLFVYILISLDLIHRTIAAMLGASLLLGVSYTIGSINPAYHIISFQTAMQKIDMNVILLLMGMMIIVGVLKRTGVFQWSAYKCFQFARGNVAILSIILMTLTAVVSAFLDNVTTMLLLTPVTIEIALSLRISPLALLIPEVLASNVGGTATLIGDPPNIMIGSYTGMTFMAFVENLAPLCVIAIVALFVVNKFYYGKLCQAARVENLDQFVQRLREQYQITDRTLLSFGSAVLAFVVFLFVSHGYWHMEVSIAALIGASVLFTFAVITKKIDIQTFLQRDIEWPTLLFFTFLFIVVGCVEETGLLALIADWVMRLSRGNLVSAICLILWTSAIMSAFVDNIPFTATMLPITAYLSQVVSGADSNVLWWALALGACFGGNGTMIGASANVVTMGIAEAAGYPIRFLAFMKVGFVYMLVSVAIANFFLLIFY